MACPVACSNLVWNKVGAFQLSAIEIIMHMYDTHKLGGIPVQNSSTAKQQPLLLHKYVQQNCML